MMTTQAERIAKLETKHNMAVNDIKGDIGDIKTDIKDIKSMMAPMPELIRKVNEHHKDLRDDIKPSVREHKIFVQGLIRAGCPAKKVMPEDLEELEKEKRRNRWKAISVAISLAALLATNISMCDIIHDYNEYIEQEVSK